MDKITEKEDLAIAIMLALQERDAARESYKEACEQTDYAHKLIRNMRKSCKKIKKQIDREYAEVIAAVKRQKGIREAKRRAEEASLILPPEYKLAMKKWNDTKSHLGQAERAFRLMKAERKRLKDELHCRQISLVAAINAYDKFMLAERMSQIELDKKLLENAVIKISNADGTMNVYYGGVGTGDGPGHGHIVLDKNGRIIYHRPPAAQN